MESTVRYIARDFARPFVNGQGEFMISWCGKVLPVIGITEDGAWIVPRY